jgi:hypothetical protein
VGTAQITQFSAAPTVLGRDLHDPPNGGSARGYHRDLCDGGSQHTCGVFAVDSIPAFLAVTTDPFVVYTSNVFGLLGMRALYFLLAGAAARFRFLRPRLAGHSGRHGRQAAPCGRLQVPYLGLASLRPRRRRHSVLSIRDTK